MQRLDIFALFLPEVKELLVAKDFNGLKELLKKIHSMDLAEGLKRLEPQERILVFKLLSVRKALEVFENLPTAERSYLLNNLESTEVSQILNEMAPDERAKLFKALPPKVVKKFFAMMKKEEAEDVRRLLTYREGAAGSFMTTEFIELKKDMTARRAILALQDSQRAGQTRTVYSAYVTNDNHRLVGGVSIQELLMAPPDIPIREIMSGVDIIKVSAHMPKEDVAKWFSKYNLLDAPVVDENDTLLGVITVDDIVDVIQREATRDIYEIGKMSAKAGEEIRYARATVSELVKRRAGWLIFLLVFDFLTGTVLKTFQHALSSVVALAFFIPMLLDTGGNAGAQTSVTIIRGFATGDVTFKNIWRIARMEILAAFVMGIIVGAVAFVRALLLQQDPSLAIVVGITMMSIVLLAILTGVFLPLASKRIGLDPAVLAGPITTSIVDIFGLIIYFRIAQIFIPALRQ